jgi:hypothetical protein
MTTARQLAGPSPHDIDVALVDRPSGVRAVALALRALVLETLPGVSEVLDTKDGMIGYGAHQFGASGWGLVAIAPYKNWTNLQFVTGASLPDPTGLLEGAGKSMRHVRVHSVEDLEQKRTALVALLRAAAGID